MKRLWQVVMMVVAGAAPLAAQVDTSGRIHLMVNGVSNAQPGLIVLAGAGLDSVRAIVRRDLDYSNRFTVDHFNDSTGVLKGPLNPSLYKESGATWIVELEPGIGAVNVKLYDAVSGALRQEATRAAMITGIGDARMSIHQISDQIVSWTGGIGIAATRIAFVMGLHETWRVDADGANVVRVSPAATQTASPVWSPDGSTIAYSRYADGRWRIFLQKLGSGLTQVPSDAAGNDYGGAFSPDGRTFVYTHGGERGSDIYDVDIVHLCCTHRLTTNGALADNVTPVYSPNGHQIAFVSQRTGTPELYVMDDDGTNPRPLLDAGGAATYRPAWSPDGAKVAFGRDTPSGGRQLFYVLTTSGKVVQLTSASSSEDPSWAPDSRHLVFKSRRSGREQLWILDTESGASRQLPTPGVAQYPAWSRGSSPNP